jgi:hypothetical protein
VSRLDDLMQTKMTRRHFLRTLGVGIGVLFGLPAIMRILDYQGSTSNGQSSYGGYGSSTYGGIEDHKPTHTFGDNR